MQLEKPSQEKLSNMASIGFGVIAAAITLMVLFAISYFVGNFVYAANSGLITLLYAIVAFASSITISIVIGCTVTTANEGNDSPVAIVLGIVSLLAGGYLLVGTVLAPMIVAGMAPVLILAVAVAVTVFIVSLIIN